jgi:hypothetical protein
MPHAKPRVMPARDPLAGWRAARAAAAPEVVPPADPVRVLLRLAEAAAAALGEPDPALAHEKAVIAAARAAEAAGAVPVKPAGEHAEHVAALLRGAECHNPTTRRNGAALT